MFGQPSVTRKRLCRNNKLSLAEIPAQGKAICEFCPRPQNNYVNRLYNHLRARSLYANIWKCLVYGEGVNNITLARPQCVRRTFTSRAACCYMYMFLQHLKAKWLSWLSLSDYYRVGPSCRRQYGHKGISLHSITTMHYFGIPRHIESLY